MDYRPAMRLAAQAATASPDPSTQNGAVLLTSDGHVVPATAACNEFPPGVDYSDERWERPAKYGFIEHAERGAIFAAARQGITTRGKTLVSPWAACADCARAIICVGISRLVTMQPQQEHTHGRWNASIEQAFTMLHEAGVELVLLDGPLGGCKPLRRNGSLIEL